MGTYHLPVLLKSAVDGLITDPKGIYVDATFGGGGHSREILSRLQNGKLFAFDQDEDASRNAFSDPGLIFIRHNFRYLQNFLRYYRVDRVDGILADLGVSWHDFDVAGRGFSFRFDAPLDMRMNRGSELTAAGIINDYSPEQLTAVFSKWGEIHNAGRLVSAITEARTESSIMTTGQFLRIIGKCVPRTAEKNYLARVFQALRIEVNDEIAALGEFLTSALEILKPGGRIAIIAYHSLEDRLVKNFFRTGNLEGQIHQDFFGNFETPFRLITRKAIIPGDDEIRMNPRSRSAKLRIAEKKQD